MAIILGVFHKSHKGKNVLVVFHHKTVKEQDAGVFKNLSEILQGENITLDTVVGLQEALPKCDDKTLVIFDECDHHLLDSEPQFIEELKQAKIYGAVGLSASLPDHLNKDLFKLEHKLGYKLHNSHVFSKIVPNTETKMSTS